MTKQERDKVALIIEDYKAIKEKGNKINIALARAALIEIIKRCIPKDFSNTILSLLVTALLPKEKALITIMVVDGYEDMGLHFLSNNAQEKFEEEYGLKVPTDILSEAIRYKSMEDLFFRDNPFEKKKLDKKD